ncbi:hypothetical protein GCM10008171_32400 [Methylopila jiangsuensis]|uniref:Uncharacterized protein n=1 Tax=Methylopila jiangsuensis TaxID=586230 RepID=A0A9W6JHZ3_9HYPH|nr:hypothetical protein [Methylopila jiangsuensis]MDR6284625.1 hypothetical protein [Methylopila jiangsuensis]GLK77986.1 hypothetical protein GCM10008171_32400 [Methylopila jiangsuensis]
MAGELTPYERAKLIVEASKRQQMAATAHDVAAYHMASNYPCAASEHQEDAEHDAAYARRALLHLIHGERIDD